MDKTKTVKNVAQIYRDTISNLDNVLVGQTMAKKVIAASILSDTSSKLLLTGNTGVGKTTIANYIASSFNARRISITSDMLPSDIKNLLRNASDLELLQIDEFNRASGKVQSAFIELLEEKQITVDGEQIKFNDFHTIATQNSADIAGVFNAPQAIYDRFDINVNFSTLTDEEKRLILFGGFEPKQKSYFNKEDMNYVARCVKEFSFDKTDENMLLSIFNMIDNMIFNSERLFAGSNIRAHKFALKLAKLMAMTEGRDYILPADIAPLIKYVYMHRIDQNVAKMTDDNVEDIFYSKEQEVLKLKRKKFEK